MTKSVTKMEKEGPKAQKLDSMVSVTVAFSVAQGMRPQRQRAMHRLCHSLYTSFKTPRLTFDIDWLRTYWWSNSNNAPNKKRRQKLGLVSVDRHGQCNKT